MDFATWERSGVRLWLARLGDVAEERWQALYDQMAPERKARCRRYRRQEDRRLCVLADALVRRALAGATGLRPEALTFAQAPGGKPRALGVDKHFNLSHSGALALCAVADFPVGVDIQRARSVSDALGRHMARAGYTGRTQAEFFTWWVHQEAAGKLAGTGLTLEPLTGERDALSGVLEEPDGQYFYCVCAPKGSFLCENNVIQ